MMHQQSRKKHEKYLARHRKVAEKEKHHQAKAAAMRAEHQYEVAYPQFEIEHDNTTPQEFVALVRAAVREIDFEERSQFAAEEAAFYRAVKVKGHKAATEEFRHAQTGGFGPWEPGPHTWPRKLGHIVFDAIPQEELLNFIPYHDFFVCPHRHRILVKIQSLVRVNTPDGPYYHSKRRPTISVEGESKIVCFGCHAVEQMCERVVPGSWQNYDGMGEIFAYLNQCQEFEIAPLYPDQTSFTFYDDCAKGYWSRKVAEEVLGDRYQPDKDYSYRVGYCPAFVHGGLLLGKTLLYPGYGNTPEFGAILSSGLPQQEKTRLIQEVKGLTIQRFVRTGDFAILKWFHEHGVPQVIPRETGYAGL
jgi:hypothetical protein